MMNVLDIDCTTGIVRMRDYTPEELMQSQQDMARAEAERTAKEAAEATEAAERLALATWIASHPDLPEAARNALARATGVTLPAPT
ncbi:MAG: hypothetical protein EBS72_14145 [Rhizobiales bacterium]|nr:hypothetical protein [Hyphomicrobiales bacterium]